MTREDRLPALALAAAAIAHAPALFDGLGDADRVLLVRNPEVRTFSGLATMLAEGQPIVVASGIVASSKAPLGVLSTWLGWQWFQASSALHHAAGIAIAIAIAGALAALLAPRKRLAALAVLALMLHPSTADLTGSLLARGALLAVLAVMIAALRARDAAAPKAVAWCAGASLFAGLCAPGWGLLGLVAALVIPDARARRVAVLASIGAAILALTRHPGDLGGASIAAAGAAFLAWIPSTTPFVIATVSDGMAAGIVPVAILASLAIYAASRAHEDRDAALLRAGAGAMIAALVASATASREGTVSGASALALQLGVVLALAGIWDAIATRARPWMLAAFVILGAMTALRARGWASEDRLLEAIVARDADDPEALIAAARIGLRAGNLREALPFCLRYAEAVPKGLRADGCIAAAAVKNGDDETAIALLRRWSSRFPERRALRAAVLEIADAEPDPRFGEAFKKATGYNMPSRRAGER